MMTKITIEKFSFIIGILPKKKPAMQHVKTHKIPPKKLYVTKCLVSIFPIPATKGAKVLTIGTNRAITIVLAPYCL